VLGGLATFCEQHGRNPGRLALLFRRPPRNAMGECRWGDQRPRQGRGTTVICITSQYLVNGASHEMAPCRAAPITTANRAAFLWTFWKFRRS